MNKFFKKAALIALVSAISVMNLKVALDARHSDNLLATTLAAISGGRLSGEDGGSGNTGENGDDVSKCDILLYNRNMRESYKNVKITTDVGAGGYITVYGRRIRLDVDVNVGRTIRVPICEDSSGNCCAKSHLEKEVIYL